MPDSRPNPKVLLTGAGGAAAVSFIKATRDESVVLHASDMDPLGAGLYLVPPSQRHLVLGGANPDFVPHLLALCRRHAIDVLVPTVDAELVAIARARAHFMAAGVRLLLASEATLALCLDKLTLLGACGGVVPVGRYGRLDAAFSSGGWEFPVMVKPRTGSGSRGIEKVTSPAQLDALSHAGHLLVQEYLPGDEYSVDVLAAGDGRIVAAVPRVRLKVDSGVAVTARTLHDAELEELACRVAKQIGLRYFANIQFRRNAAGTPILLEVNARFAGTMPLTVHSGINMPLLALRDVLGQPPPEGPLPFRDAAVVRYWAEEYIDPAALDAWHVEGVSA